MPSVMNRLKPRGVFCRDGIDMRFSLPVIYGRSMALPVTSRVCAELSPIHPVSAKRRGAHTMGLPKATLWRPNDIASDAVGLTKAQMGNLHRLWQGCRVKGSIVNGLQNAGDPIRPTKPFPALVRLNKQRVETALKFEVAVDLCNDFESERRPRCQRLSPPIWRHAAPDFDRAFHTNGLNEIDALHAAALILRASIASLVRSSSAKTPLSKRETVPCVSPSLSANPAWDSPRALRVARMSIGRIYAHTNTASQA